MDEPIAHEETVAIEEPTIIEDAEPDEPEPFVEEPVIVSTTKPFRFKGTRVLLTYATHINKAELEDHLRRGREQIVWIRMAHEGADTKTAYDHTHVLLTYNKRVTITDARHWDYKADYPEVAVNEPEPEMVEGHEADNVQKVQRAIIHPNMQPINTLEHFENARYYIGKEDPANADLRAMGKFNPGREPEEAVPIDAIQNCRTLNEAFKAFARKFSDIPGMLAIWRARVVPTQPEEIITPWPWQKQLWYQLEVKRSVFARSLAWIYDQKGGKGKSIFVRWLKASFPENYMSVPGVPKENDVAHAIRTHTERFPGKLKGIIFDFPRDVSSQNVYGMLENILNADMFSAKYDSTNITFPKVHVVCFANWLPNMGTTAMSDDRWDIRELTYNDELEVEMIHIPRQEARNQLIKQREKLRAEAVEENIKAGRGNFGAGANPFQGTFRKAPFKAPVPKPAEVVEPAAKRMVPEEPAPMKAYVAPTAATPIAPVAGTAASGAYNGPYKTKIDPRTGQPYAQRTDAEWKAWREANGR